MAASKVYQELSKKFISKSPKKTGKSTWLVYRGDFFNRNSEDFSFDAPEGLQFDRLFGFFHPENIITTELLQDGRTLVTVLDENDTVVMSYLGIYERNGQ